MFRRLKTKLTVLYGGLFTAILLMISAAVYTAVSSNVTGLVRQELTTSGQVFDRIWTLRASQLRDAADLLSRDFGFRAAMATNDGPTVASALDNLRVRLGVDVAMVLTVDGQATVVGRSGGGVAPDVRSALENEDGASGVLLIDGALYEAVSVPVRAPITIGWVVFASRLDDSQMASLEKLSAIPLEASVLYKDNARTWRDAARKMSGPDQREIGDFITASLGSRDQGARQLALKTGASVALARPLTGLDPAHPVVLLLHYPMDRALEPYRILLGLGLLIAGAGLVALLAGTWILARSVTRPIAALQSAAGRLQRGEYATVAVETQDELGLLAASFNEMSSQIVEREAESVRFAEALAQARDRAEAANRAKSSFLANMSHEVRTPLNGVLGIAGVLAGTSLERKQREMVSVIEHSAVRLQRVLDDVLDLARVEAGRLQIIDDVFNLEDTVATLARGVGVQCEAKGLTFQIQAPFDGLGHALGDRARLEQILGNLLSNALKFTEAGGVTLIAERVGDLCRFQIRDTGIGFDADAGDALFEPFKQADDSITRRFGGTGLGLSICRELARAMGGDVSAVGRPGEGATFTLELPLLPREATAAAAQPVVHQNPHDPDLEPGALRVLAADDNDTNLMVVRLILESMGAEMISAVNGAEAVEAFKAGPVDLVLMDMQMPVMDGVTAIRHIRAHELQYDLGRTPVLILSANALSEHVEAGRDAGADGHVAKPITPAGLIAAITNVLIAAEDNAVSLAATG